MTMPIRRTPATLTPFLLAVLLAAPAVRAETPPPGEASQGHAMPAAKAPAKLPSPAAAQLEMLKALAGTWTGKASHGGSPGEDTSVTWRVTAAGSAVVETIIAFDFVRGSNMRPGDMHMHSAKIALAGQDRIETEWTTWNGGKAADRAKFTLTRQK